MEKEIKIKSIDHEELMTILSDALTGNTKAIYMYVPQEFRHLKKSDTREGNLADVLLAGGEVIVCDMYSLEGNQIPYQGHYLSAQSESYEYATFDGPRIGKVVCYRINLQNLLDGWSNNSEAAPYLIDIEEGRDDMYTGYNLIQIAVFGEIFYS